MASLNLDARKNPDYLKLKTISNKKTIAAANIILKNFDLAILGGGGLESVNETVIRGLWFVLGFVGWPLVAHDGPGPGSKCPFISYRGWTQNSYTAPECML